MLFGPRDAVCIGATLHTSLFSFGAISQYESSDRSLSSSTERIIQTGRQLVQHVAFLPRFFKVFTKEPIDRAARMLLISEKLDAEAGKKPPLESFSCSLGLEKLAEAGGSTNHKETASLP
jgi:hypothetical protein